MLIREDKSKKCVGEASLFISFNFNQKIIDIIKEAGDAVWDKKTKLWEVPINKLAFLIDKVSIIEDIDIEVLPDVNVEHINTSINFKTQPYPYQLEGIDYMLNHPDCLLLDVAGLGKTLQVIYLAEELKARGECEHCLIICGINALKTNWEKEIKRHSNEDCVIIGKKVNSKGKISYSSIKDRAEQLYNKLDPFFIIINIESIRDRIIIDAILDSKNKFDLMVVDECHKCKSPTTSQSKGLIKIAKASKRHIGLTGTPLVNSPLDAYLPLKFIGKEKASFTKFKDFYCNFEFVFGHRQIKSYKNMDILKDEIDRCSIRRDKSLLNLPPKIIVPEYLEMSDAQYKFYTDISNGVLEEADRIDIKTTSLLGLVTRLRQASTYPMSLTTQDIDSVKLNRAEELVEEITSNVEKVVIFSPFKEPLNVLYDRLKKYNPVLGTGDIPDEEVSKNIDRFQTDPECKVYLGTTQKSGTGITLTAASYEIFLSSEWTHALESQAEDRCHRLGSNKSVTIYKLICNGTIDERIQAILNRKRDISDYMIDNKVNNADELKELLGLDF